MKIHIFFALAASISVTSSLSANSAYPVEIECRITPIDRSKIHRNERFATSATTQSASNNWSGYVAAPSFQQSVQGSVTYAAGSWVVPELTSTPDTSYCAIWVGIDGYLDGTVEQLGTSHDWVNGAQDNYAWFEMYPNGAYEITGFPVNTGDQISVRIGYKGNGNFNLSMINHTQNVSTTIPAGYTVSSVAQRSTAEWVVEAPYYQGILPLSDFKLATFNYCSAIIDGLSGTINNGAWQNDVITMVGSTGAVEAQPSALIKNGTCFTVTWKSE